ncbi:hypothetical protein QTP88_000597 [Uroleucon formosanum]
MQKNPILMRRFNVQLIAYEVTIKRNVNLDAEESDFDEAIQRYVVTSIPMVFE